ncbi:piggyBac transposable element-derived protein 4 [Trichonephila inaurata madagascariensis]|uniref:PiggyBac transposable element-derived protein 4 n=1 Tax=Trichonephila inaurata madagascariensis TaxID=2747483 RepID=A0A8X6Y7X0_9ARAC|nr:piggyBac transposable element-derived protein 4 [Trichonephila inaurata madagascariensis]
MAQKRKLDYYDDDFDFDTESLSSRFSFIGDVGMKACVANISDPLEHFELFLTDEIVDHIVTETNIFAAENLNKFKSKEHSRTLIIGMKLMRMN